MITTSPDEANDEKLDDSKCGRWAVRNKLWWPPRVWSSTGLQHLPLHDGEVKIR